MPSHKTLLCCQQLSTSRMSLLVRRHQRPHPPKQKELHDRNPHPLNLQQHVHEPVRPMILILVCEAGTHPSLRRLLRFHDPRRRRRRRGLSPSVAPVPAGAGSTLLGFGGAQHAGVPGPQALCSTQGEAFTWGVSLCGLSGGKRGSQVCTYAESLSYWCRFMYSNRRERPLGVKSETSAHNFPLHR